MLGALIVLAALAGGVAGLAVALWLLLMPIGYDD